jgi:LytS/YehU family sensor histidine kinase
MFQLLKSDLVLTHAADKQNELRLQAAETQLRILQAQIEPHFLFNTLANVRQLYRSDLEAGENMMDHLIVYLRSAMEDLRCETSTVGKEMDLALHYLAIMKIRMGERLAYSFIIPDTNAQINFPPAMLISLVENAIKHGLQNKDDGKLTINAVRENDNLRVTVEDNGAGFSSVEGTGVGLSNIRQRLEGLYGNRAWLEVGAMQTGGFMASIVIPLAEEP